MLREIVLDTETTGLDPRDGHRIVEIGCLELVNHLPSGRTFHTYVNPEREVPEDAFRVHGLSTGFLADQPVFAEVVEAFLEVVGGEAPLVIHNAAFDLKFLDAELARLGRDPWPRDRVVDTLALAQRRFPGASASLDALCRRFGVDASARTRHGALLDSELLAEVYLHLIGGRQPDLGLTVVAAGAGPAGVFRHHERRHRPPRPHAPTAAELAAHAAFLEGLTDPIWRS
ncbi:MAG TPA: DNA polymerase III subunit epsilon [Geminicoccaceae bacterium]|nr:DNA polymerase III subunit epsilon [Geminicoccaceae bacterium]